MKRDLFGIKAGSVERFSPDKAARLIVERMAEEFDPKKKEHTTAPGANAALEAIEVKQKGYFPPRNTMIAAAPVTK